MHVLEEVTNFSYNDESKGILNEMIYYIRC